MSYTSYGFLMLVLISLLLYYSFRGRFQNLVLLFASILFILWAGGLSSLFFIALSAAISFLAGIAMDRAQAGRKKAVYVLAMPIKCGIAAFLLCFYFGLLLSHAPELFDFTRESILKLNNLLPGGE